jgi:hypothetical protein
MSLFKSDPVTVDREVWDALRKDVQELKEIVAGMASAMSAVADGASALSNSPMGKMLGQLFPGE